MDLFTQAQPNCNQTAAGDPSAHIAAKKENRPGNILNRAGARQRSGIILPAVKGIRVDTELFTLYLQQ